MRQAVILKIMILLALVQAMASLLRALDWMHIGVDLFGEGILLLPFIGAVVFVHGLFISVVALLYALFVFGAGRSWAWWSCLIAAVINLLLVLLAVIRGASLTEIIAWTVIPVILIFYLFSQTGRGTLKVS